MEALRAHTLAHGVGGGVNPRLFGADRVTPS
jgi:hypothetical protein